MAPSKQARRKPKNLQSKPFVQVRAISTTRVIHAELFVAQEIKESIPFKVDIFANKGEGNAIVGINVFCNDNESFHHMVSTLQFMGVHVELFDGE